MQVPATLKARRLTHKNRAASFLPQGNLLAQVATAAGSNMMSCTAGATLALNVRGLAGRRSGRRDSSCVKRRL